jgi:hypothetical protein
MSFSIASPPFISLGAVYYIYDVSPHALAWNYSMFDYTKLFFGMTKKDS